MLSRIDFSSALLITFRELNWSFKRLIKFLNSFSYLFRGASWLSLKIYFLWWVALKEMKEKICKSFSFFFSFLTIFEMRFIHMKKVKSYIIPWIRLRTHFQQRWSWKSLLIKINSRKMLIESRKSRMSVCKWKNKPQTCFFSLKTVAKLEFEEVKRFRMSKHFSALIFDVEITAKWVSSNYNQISSPKHSNVKRFSIKSFADSYKLLLSPRWNSSQCTFCNSREKAWKRVIKLRVAKNKRLKKIVHFWHKKKCNKSSAI